MIDTLIKLLEKLTELVKIRKETEDKPFELLASPLYSNLEIIHGDYLCNASVGIGHFPKFC
jgi:hypothetical protein